MGNSYRELCDFHPDARRQAGSELRLVQAGSLPSDWKPMPSIGHGVMEIRIHDPGEYRIIYVAKFPEAVYVLAAFQKKSQKTAQRYVELARRAYAEVQERQKR